MADKHGFSVKIFIPNGEPEGLRIVEKSNWTGQGIAFPRSLMPEVRKRPELKSTGVYILWGPSDSGQLPMLYVGEGDSVLPRLDSHIRNKEFWTQALVFISKDQNLNKAHVQYLEARLVELAKAAKRCQLDNGNAPQRSLLSEADTADVESFLEDVLLCLPVMGMNFFEQAKTSKKASNCLFVREKGIHATGNESSQGFVVHKDSQAVLNTVPSCGATYVNIRNTLIDNGVMVKGEKTYVFSQDYTFNSPSAAGCVVLGVPCNGLLTWIDKDGRSLKEIQEAKANES